jgi:iron complex outermembrane receptor protein
MDALYDDSDIVNLNYIITDLGEFSKELNVQLYDSRVEHPMSTFYRMSSGADSANERISKLETQMTGAKVINTMDVSDTSELTVGLDFSSRNWDGSYQGFGTSAGITGLKGIPDVDTDNQALFVELNQDYDALNLKFGARLDDSEITPGAGTLGATDFSAFSLFGFATYQMDETHKLFGGVGKASRVPDARELYFLAAMGPSGMLIGNPDLEQTTNTEIDLGIEHKSASLRLKAKLFYSMLDNFIHYNASKAMRRFDNVDATIYGFDVSASYLISAEMNLDFGVAWQRGEKDEALAGQTDTDLAEIPPMKMNVALNYSYSKGSNAMIEVVAADSWSDYDADNGEQELDSWAVLNLKLKHQFNDQFGITVGVDNLLDETYAVSNTYKDLTLLADGTGEVMLLNEPGRYVYLNAVYSF